MKPLTERELEIMQVLWSLGRARLGEVQEALNRQGGEPVAPATVHTQLDLLILKGYVTRAGRRFRLYASARSRVQVTRDLLHDFLSRVGLGRVPAFLIQRLRGERLTDEDRAALQEILRESEPSPSRRSASAEETTP
jgi:BlaI family penicillinase repressor